MTTETKRNTTSASKDVGSEALFAIWLIAFAILEVVFLILILANTFKNKESIPTEPVGENTTATSVSTVSPEPPKEIPLFSGATVPIRPVESETYQAESDALFSSYGILIDVQSGTILGGKNLDTTFSPASMTKVMTLIVACEQLNESDLDHKIPISQEIYDYSRAGLYEDSSLFGFDVGDEVTVKDLLYGIGMKSASDCVVPIVYYLRQDEASDIRASEEAFVALMNQRAAEMGLTSTHFDNAIGYDSQQNYTTVREMAMIMSVAMQSDLIENILCSASYSSQAYYYKGGLYTPFNISYYNTLHDHRVKAYKEFTKLEFSLTTTTLDGGKTGYLNSSFLVCQATAKAGGGKYIVVLGDAFGGNITNSCGMTMQDLKYLLDTYVK